MRIVIFIIGLVIGLVPDNSISRADIQDRTCYVGSKPWLDRQTVCTTQKLYNFGSQCYHRFHYALGELHFVHHATLPHGPGHEVALNSSDRYHFYDELQQVCGIWTTAILDRGPAECTAPRIKMDSICNKYV